MAFCHRPGETNFYFGYGEKFLVPGGCFKRKETKAALMEGAVAVHMP